jgi:hypothetical protein
MEGIEWIPIFSIEPYFKWFDLWVGLYIERYKGVFPSHPGGWAVFIGIFPTIGVKVSVNYIPRMKRRVL